MSYSLSSAVVSLTRRGVALVAAALVCSALLIAWGSTSAHADPYPPSNPSSGIESTSLHRPSGPSSSVANESTHRSTGLSSTGFQAFAATTIAVALLGGGAIFLGLGRRRRHG